jgi:hypothetical protein
MHRGVVLDLVPWLLLVVGLAAALRWLVHLGGGRWQATRYRRLHSDQAGAVQTLSFVLTLPFFVMTLLLIVQASQLMVAQMVVEYAAVASARAASVWIPAATVNLQEGENCISYYTLDSNQTNTGGGTRYVIQPGSPKYQRIQWAATLACAPIAPSRPVANQGAPPAGALTALEDAYSALSPSFASNKMIPTRLSNKLAYSQANTSIKLTFIHPTLEPPLATLNQPDDSNEFYFNEIGWQDSLTVTVYHRLALLPGPGRLLFGRALSPTGSPDQVASSIQLVGDTYTYNLSAATTIINEGEKPVLHYVYQP